MNSKIYTMFPDTYRVAVYCRLSKDDELQGESASISNQRAYLTDYCKQQGWDVVAYYADDGYTGLNMNRPDLQRLLKDCEKHLVNLVITKDASRLGRNKNDTGFLREDFFPRNGVRYIAVNDDIDTLYADYSTTMDIYAECSMEKQQEVFADLNGKIMNK